MAKTIYSGSIGAVLRDIAANKWILIFEAASAHFHARERSGVAAPRPVGPVSRGAKPGSVLEERPAVLSSPEEDRER